MDLRARGILFPVGLCVVILMLLLPPLPAQQPGLTNESSKTSVPGASTALLVSASKVRENTPVKFEIGNPALKSAVWSLIIVGPGNHQSNPIPMHGGELEYSFATAGRYSVFARMSVEDKTFTTDRVLIAVFAALVPPPPPRPYPTPTPWFAFWLPRPISPAIRVIILAILLLCLFLPAVVVLVLSLSKPSVRPTFHARWVDNPSAGPRNVAIAYELRLNRNLSEGRERLVGPPRLLVTRNR